MIPANFPELPDFPPGEVWLAGAGPGDPRLLTVLALHALTNADDVVYDALVDPRTLQLARSGAELIAAGKRGGKPSPHQRDINEVLIERARLGRRVLRLKGGDPFVFGRGWDEAQALTAARWSSARTSAAAVWSTSSWTAGDWPAPAPTPTAPGRRDRQ